jgi:hypothetical protein
VNASRFLTDVGADFLRPVRNQEATAERRG